MLKYLCLDKIIKITNNIEDPCQKTLEWVLKCWSYIKHVPSIDEAYCYDVIISTDCTKDISRPQAPTLNSPYGPSVIIFSLHRHILDISVSLCTLNPHLVVPIYERGGHLYVNLDYKVYTKVQENEIVKNHLVSGISVLSFYLLSISQVKQLKLSELTGPRLNLKTFLSTCRSFKSVKFDDLFCSANKQIPYIILENLGHCQQIENFWSLNCSNLDYDGFCKYFLGIDLDHVVTAHDCLLEVNNINNVSRRYVNLHRFIESIRKIVSTSKPRWPKLINIEEFDRDFYNDQVDLFVTIGVLSFLILKDLTHFNSVSFLSDYLTFLDKAIQKELEVSFNYDFLAKQFHLFTYNVKPVHLDPIKRVFTENPFLYEEISYVKFRLDGGKINFLEPAIDIVLNAPNLKQVQVMIKGHFDDGPSLICSAPVDNLIVVYECSHEKHPFKRVIQYIFRSFPFVKNLKLVICSWREIAKSQNYFTEAIPGLNCLESINVTFPEMYRIEKYVLSFMIKLSQVVEKHTKLTYSMINWYGRTNFYSILRLHGWISIAQVDVPFRNMEIF